METVSIRKTVLFVQIWVMLNVSPSVALCRFPAFSKLQLPLQTIGPEASAFDRKGGGPYTGIADGRIVKYQGPRVGFTDFAVTSPNRTKAKCDGKNGPELQQICGRPFGLGFYYKTGDLYITDAFYGLVVVGPSGGLVTRVPSFQGRNFAFLDALDIDQRTGVVYFVDSGAIFLTGNTTRIVESGDISGRLFKYDIATKQVTLLLSGLSGPIGVALSKDNSYVLITESIAQRIRRFWLKGAKANSSDVFANVDGIPDNIKRTVLGDFWVAISNTKQRTTFSLGQRINRFGKVVETCNFTAQYKSPNGITEVQEYKGKLYVGSLDQNFIGVFGV
ncbi:protein STRICTOSIDINE SYNTHASE-LIKE 11-like [Solanum tuberosum]|uniref:Strictosidine synthase conserved region domain-containing protein n=1 Tax=Solanum tuberosum TaxID=4113 RepID=M1CAD9_SOLTU|nr:PREDICTED: protein STRICTOSIDINE SYNTHASE-LIKE 11-like [Solanum tuberosum]